MGKEVIVAADGPGFLVNRCGRPFNGEGLRLLQERVATHEQIDRICRLGGGFRMGPFELMDLVGIDVGFEVAKSFEELSFGEPRWRPNPIQARMVAAGRLGRKSGRGYYEYAEDGSYRADDPEPRALGGADGMFLTVLGDGPVADMLRERARQAGYELREGGPSELVLDARVRPEESPPGGAPVGSCAPPAASRHAASRARWASTYSPRRPARRADPAAHDPGVRGHGRAGVLRAARLRDRVGGGRARARARPDREPARERGGLRDRRGRWLGRRRGHRADARALPSARAGGVERVDRPRPRAGGARRPVERAPRGALPRRAAAPPRRGARAYPRG